MGFKFNEFNEDNKSRGPVEEFEINCWCESGPKTEKPNVTSQGLGTEKSHFSRFGGFSLTHFPRHFAHTLHLPLSQTAKTLFWA